MFTSILERRLLSSQSIRYTTPRRICPPSPSFSSSSQIRDESTASNDLPTPNPLASSIDTPESTLQAEGYTSESLPGTDSKHELSTASNHASSSTAANVPSSSASSSTTPQLGDRPFEKVSPEEAGMSHSPDIPSRTTDTRNEIDEQAFSNLIGTNEPVRPPFARSRPLDFGSRQRPERDPLTGRPIPPQQPRKLRGVHANLRRGQGQTPEEAKTFNKILGEIFADLQKAGPLRPGSSLNNDPFNLGTLGGGTLWGGQRVAEKRKGLFSRDVEVENEALTTEVDLLKEEMAAIGTDVELVAWAKERVFAPIPDELGGITFPRTYPRILAELLKTIRINFGNPNLALALFRHAQSHSPESYLIGCLAPVYNEALRIRWESFRDLIGVDQGVQEMEVNGVRWDKGTQQVVAKVADDVLRDLNNPQTARRWGDDAFAVVQRLEAKVQEDIAEQEDIYHFKQSQKAVARSNGGVFPPRRERRHEEEDSYL